MRKSPRCAGLVVLLATWLIGASAADAVADGSYPVGGEAVAVAGSTTSLSITVPRGLVPRQLSGTVVLDPPVDGGVVLVGGRTVARLTAAAEQTIAVPVSLADVDDGSLQVALRMPADGVSCAGSEGTAAPASGGGTATLGGVRLAYVGQETAPATVDAFLSDDVRRVDVLVAPGSDETLVEAALVAVGALSARYPATVPVALASSATAVQRSGPGQRVVRLEAGAGAGRLAVSAPGGVPTLTLTGAADGVLQVARALGSQALDLVSSDRASDVTAEVTATPRDLSSTLTELGSPRLTLDSSQSPTSYTSVLQDAFGGPVEAFTFHLVGVHTPVPAGTEARLDVYLGGALLGSVPLGDDSVLDATLTAPAATLRAQNGLELKLRTAQADTGCPPVLPVEVQVDGDRSTVVATRGRGAVTGLQLFPQALGGVLPVALRAPSADLLPAAVDAATLVAALQRAASAPLAVTLVDPDELVASGSSGLLVGAVEADTTALQAPIRLAQVRLMTGVEGTFSVDLAEPFAALQAVLRGDQALLVLGSWSPEGTAEALQHSTAAWVGARGWNQADQDYLLANGAGAVSTVRAASVVPQDAVLEQEGAQFVWWLVGGLVLVLLVLVAQVATGRRKRQIRDLVRAQQAVDADITGD